jgi:hypothetical protein
MTRTSKINFSIPQTTRLHVSILEEVGDNVQSESQETIHIVI